METATGDFSVRCAVSVCPFSAYLTDTSVWCIEDYHGDRLFGTHQCLDISIQPTKPYHWRSWGRACSRKLDDVPWLKHRVILIVISRHGLILTFAFTSVNGSVTFTPLKPVETSFASELIAYWLSFVRAGDPNTFKLPRSPFWTSYSGVARNRIVLQQDPAGTTTRSGSFLEREVSPETERCTVVGSQRSQEN
jgi:hypothetical protein